MHIAVLLLSCAVAAGCIRDNLPDCENNGFELGADEYGICFELALDDFGGSATRADLSEPKYENGDEDENYVNFRTMRVLFFDANDRYVCDLLTDTNACNVFDVSDGNYRRWFIGIMLPRLGEFEDDIRDLVSTSGFKIAVFANWDKRDVTITPHPDYVIGDDVKGNLGYIAHCLVDNTYSSGVSDEKVVHSAYTHVIGANGEMGAWYDWVESHFSDKYEADMLMRSGMPMKTSGSADSSGGTGNDQGANSFYEDTSIPTVVFCDYDLSTGENNGKGFWYSRTERDNVTYTYRNLWTVWDFSGGKSEPAFKRGAFADQWKAINSHLPESFETKGSFNGLELVKNRSVYQNDAVTLVQNAVYWNGDYEEPVIGNNSLTQTKEYLHFKATTDGTLYIQATGNGAIGIHTGIMYESPNEDKNEDYRYVYSIESAKPVYDGKGDIIGGGITVDVTDGPFDIWIYALGGDVTITEMEFVKDRYMFDTDRIGKQPDKDKQLGMPMYGIQEFGPVGEYWLPGEYFNVSRDSYNSARKEGYQYRPIWMLRSVAKVELKVSKALGGAQSVKPSSIYMRSMNRSSRYEPKDFSTPTNLIWYGSEYYKNDKDYQYENEKYSDVVGIYNEVENIKHHGIIYNNGTYDDKAEWTYRQFTSWYYGIWQDIIGWNWNGEDLKRYAEEAKDVYGDGDYPRVFNARVARSDYARFIYGGEDGGYWYYYLYMPEKNIDDTDDTGDRSKRPKVAHIEMRFEDTESGEVFNNDDNLDDNHAYRIYFTDNGRFGSGVGRDEYDSNGNRHDWGDGEKPEYYEQYAKGLETHWPVVRNTIYRFTLNGLNSTDITVEVCGAASRRVDINFY